MTNVQKGKKGFQPVNSSESDVKLDVSQESDNTQHPWVVSFKEMVESRNIEEAFDKAYSDNLSESETQALVYNSLTPLQKAEVDHLQGILDEENSYIDVDNMSNSFYVYMDDYLASEDSSDELNKHMLAGEFSISSWSQPDDMNDERSIWVKHVKMSVEDTPGTPPWIKDYSVDKVILVDPRKNKEVLEEVKNFISEMEERANSNEIV